MLALPKLFSALATDLIQSTVRDSQPPSVFIRHAIWIKVAGRAIFYSFQNAISRLIASYSDASSAATVNRRHVGEFGLRLDNASRE